MDFEIPPRDSLTVEGYGDLSEDTEFLWLMPHMHSRGTHMTVWVGEPDPVTIYETHDWEWPDERVGGVVHAEPDLDVRARTLERGDETAVGQIADNRAHLDPVPFGKRSGSVSESVGPIGE